MNCHHCSTEAILLERGILIAKLFVAVSQFVDYCATKNALALVNKDAAIYVKDSEAKVASGCNVQLYEAVDPDAQTWVIEEVSDGKYKIVSIKDNSLALTANGNTSGSSSGKDQTSEGNVFISLCEYSSRVGLLRVSTILK